MNIQKININDLKPAAYNPRKDLKKNDAEYKKIYNSVKQFGYVEPIIINSDMTIIGGHQRYKILKHLGYNNIDCVVLDLDKEKEKALNVALNKISGDWDMSLLKDLLLDLDHCNIDLELTGFDMSEIENLMTQFHVDDENDIVNQENESKYTKKTDIPTYEPTKETQPDINLLIDQAKSIELINDIEKSNISNEIKQFLKLAAYRHLCFDYEEIAEYYAHATKEIQELMEKSALVIIDFDNAIKEGYVMLSKNISELYEVEHE